MKRLCFLLASGKPNSKMLASNKAAASQMRSELLQRKEPSVWLFLLLLFWTVPSLSQFSEDAIILTLREQENIRLDTAIAAEIDSGLAAARRTLGRLETIHAFPEYVPSELLIKTDAAWSQAWSNGQTTTGDHYIDSLGTEYGLVSAHAEFGNWFLLTFDQPLQMWRLAQLYKRHPAVIYAEPDIYGGDGDNIEYFIKDDILCFTFSHGYGDCPAGCIGRYYWYVSVTQSDSGYYGRFEEGRDFSWVVPYIYRWNIPPDYLMTLFPNADSILHAIRLAPEWWVRRHAIEGTTRLFTDPSPWGPDNNSHWYELRNELQSRRSEVGDTLRSALFDLDPDVRASAAAALKRIFLLSPTTLAFGKTYVGFSKIDSVMLTDTGTTTLIVSSVASSNAEFTVTPTGCSLAPSQSQEFYITFSPTSLGTKNGYIIFTRYGAGSPDSVAVWGRTALAFTLNERWNMVSVPMLVPDSRTTVLFPTAVSHPFAYEGSYVSEDSLTTGIGYWLKSGTSQLVAFEGSQIVAETVAVRRGWNMIGSISTPISVYNITSDPAGMVTSELFGYNGRYVMTDTLLPGRGYWIEVSRDGLLFLDTVETLAKKTNLIRRLLNDAPPPPPGEGNTSEKVLPREYALNQNYPNPFNPTTTVSYGIPCRSHVKLEIFNTLGQVVATLVIAEQEAGYYDIPWQPNTSSGLYFYRLYAKGVSAYGGEATSTSDPGKSFSQVRKMILIK